ncbi:MAG: hypothetical protein ACR2NA_03425 [Solirubrobacterales bacterium]
MAARPDAGLCDRCRWQRIVPTRRSTFSLCRRSEVDDSMPRYPRIPVMSCRAFEREGPVSPSRG